MTTTQKTAAGLVAIVIAFLLGFAPQYMQKRRLDTELQVSAEKLRMSELRDLAAMMLLETLRQNYGTARDDASKYFERLREASERATDPAIRAPLQELLTSRDEVTNALSKADPASLSQVQTILAKTQALTPAQP